MSIESIESYLPSLGHFIMAMGYVLEQIECAEPPIPSAVVLLGHVCVLSDGKALNSEETTVKLFTLIFLVSNLFVFLYDVLIALGFSISTNGILEN